MKPEYTIPPQLFTPRFDFCEEFYMDEEVRSILATTPPHMSALIEAIRYVRRVTQMSLFDCKQYVEKIRDAR